MLWFFIFFYKEDGFARHVQKRPINPPGGGGHDNAIVCPLCAPHPSHTPPPPPPTALGFSVSCQRVLGMFELAGGDDLSAWSVRVDLTEEE